MASSAPPSGPNAADCSRFLQKGTAYYNQDDYTKAITCFIKSANACCMSRVWMELCPCVSLLDAIEKDTLRHALKKKCTCPARSYYKCRNSRHQEALDALAAAHEKQGRLDLAQRDAECMICLSPRDPRGYLRLGKVLRSKDLSRLAYFTYLRGLDLVEEVNETHVLFPVLREMCKKMKRHLRLDPICTLPVELMAMVFQKLDFRSLCRCLCVSTTWRDYLTNSKRDEPERRIHDLWCTPTYAYSRASPKAPVSQLTLRNYSSYSGFKLTQLSISNTAKFGLDEKKLRCIMRACPKLESLAFRGSTICFLGKVPDDIRLPRLIKLFLGPEVVCSPKFLQQILIASAGTLEELSVFEISELNQIIAPMHVTRLEPWPMLDKLKVLRISNQRWKKMIDLVQIMNSTPNVEEVWISNMKILSTGNEPLRPWKKLRSFSLRCNDSAHFPPNYPPFFNPDMEEIYLDGAQAHDFCLVNALGPEMALSSLKSFRYFGGNPIPNGTLERWIRPGITSGSLKELDLRPFAPPTVLSGTDDTMNWFTSEHLMFLGLMVPGDLLSNRISAEATLMNLMDRFPNLRALEIGQGHVENLVLAKILLQGVKALYHHEGLLKENLREWAKEKFDAKVINGSYAPSYLEIWNHWYADAAGDCGGSRRNG
ncbi:hypothetical protein F4775DRAFT_448338 [Biscogniauxia sp. FL1348]|nr:hypothetical protein F4775DRAFT_448338 [Biscogniauxia sp. FL1348]